MKRGDQGDDVRKLQSALVELGYELPRWGVDGDLGTETIEALARFMRDHSPEGTPIDDDTDVVSTDELALVNRVLEATLGAPLGPRLELGRFHDLREVAAQKHVAGRRSWKTVTGIVLHQTACLLGEKPKRWGTVGAHLGVTRAGQVIWMHDFDKVVTHANRLNTHTIGIEMDGTYEGVEGNLKTFWRPPNEPKRMPQLPTDALVAAAMATVRWIVEEVARHGGEVKHLYAHRQASGQRQSDPGSALWQRVAMPLHQELGLDSGGERFTIGTGSPIPEAWDPSCKGVDY